MPTYTVDGPDGTTYEIEGPAGATDEEVIAAVQQELAKERRAELDKRIEDAYNVPSPTISVIVVRSASSTETMAGSSALLIICKSEYLSKPAVWFKALTGSSQVS